MASTSFAQNCPDRCQFPEHSWMNEVNICENQFSFSISRDAIVGNTVKWNFIDPISHNVFVYFLDDKGSNQFSLSDVNIPNYYTMDKTESKDIVFATFGKKKVVFYDLANNTNDTIALEIKSPIAQYESPDAVWKIETPNVFNPATAGAQSSFFSPALQQFLNATKGVGYAYVRYGKTNGIKRNHIARPIIYVDGIDFNALTSKRHDPNLGGGVNDESNIIHCGSTGWDIFISGTDASILTPGETEPFQLYPQHFDEVQRGTQIDPVGYDIIFLDFADGATYMQKNAEVLIELIKQINGTSTAFPNRKKQAVNGINYQNIVVGPSMGGQVAKFALAKMEYEERTQGGPSHCTKMYVSFDSPHKGANIPIGIQGAAWYFDRTCANTILWGRLNQPAARQLLTQHLSNMVANGEVKTSFCELTSNNPQTVDFLTTFSPQSLPADKGVLRAKFLEQLELYGKYPSLTNNIAIADGANLPRTGFGSFNNGDDLLDEKIKGSAQFMAAHFRIKAAGTQTTSIPRLKTDFGCSLNNLEVDGRNNPFNFSALTPIPNKTCGLGVLPPPSGFYYGSVENTPKTNSTAFDNAPGSYRRDLRTIHDELFNAAKNSGSNLLVRTSNFDARTTFIHTLSALDPIGLEMTDANFARDLKAEISNGTVKTPFEDFKIPSKTLQHVEIDQEILTWVNQQLESHREDLALSPNLTTIYNYGLFRKNIPSLNIGNNGFLRVNNKTFTAFLNEEEAKNKLHLLSHKLRWLNS